MKYTPRPYQDFTTRKIVELPAVGALLDMGLGKTVSTLTAVDELLNDRMEVGKVLVIAPKRVAEEVWTTEIQKWDHLRHLTTSLVLGTEAQRKEALKRKADIYVINRENVVWLVGFYGTAWPFDMIVIDELSSFKSHQSQRFKALRKVRPLASRVVGLTGTPAPNGLLDLWSQIYLLDQGERLGKTVGAYREKWFRPGRRSGHIVYDYNLKSAASETEIMQSIADICFSMKTEDYLTLPERIDLVQRVTLPPRVMEKYLAFEREQILKLEDIQDISAVNAAALTNKLLQYANGAVYDDEKNWHEVHTEKLEALEENIEAANGKPVLIFYRFKHDLARIMKALKAYKPRTLDGPDEIKAWNRGEIPVLLAHPASAGHGLNLQDGGNLIEWFGVPWSLELYQQAIKRLHRSGQTQVVRNNRLIVTGTMDEDVLAALGDKHSTQEAMIAAVKARIERYRYLAK